MVSIRSTEKKTFIVFFELFMKKKNKRGNKLIFLFQHFLLLLFF